MSTTDLRAISNWVTYVHRLTGAPHLPEERWHHTIAADDDREVCRRALLLRDCGNSILDSDDARQRFAFCEQYLARLDGRTP